LTDFNPDFFSSENDAGHNAEVNVDEINLLQNVFKLNYASLGEIEFFSDLNGFNINSSNFLIVTKSGKYVLKIWKSSFTKMLQTCELLSHLNRFTPDVPVPIGNSSAMHWTPIGTDFFSVFSYIDGKVFLPKVDDLRSYFRELGNLSMILRTYTGKSEFDPVNLDRKNVFALLERSQQKDIHVLKSEYRAEGDKLNEMFEQLKNELDKYSDNKDVSIKQWMHYDLHPKNIIRKSQNSNSLFHFLDFESCAVINPNVGWGFSLIKICRQAISGTNSHASANDVGKNSLRFIQDTEYADFLNVDLLPTFGRMEILRRLVYIVEQFEIYHSSTWLKMLPVQVQLLRESFLMFD